MGAAAAAPSPRRPDAATSGPRGRGTCTRDWASTETPGLLQIQRTVSQRSAGSQDRITISLALVLTEICRRGASTRAVFLPRHFLVRVRDDDGRHNVHRHLRRAPARRHQLAELHERATGDDSPLDPRLLEPASKGHVLLRILNNLRAIYERTGDQNRLLVVLARMQVLSPDDEIHGRIRQLAGGGSPGGSSLN